MKLFDYVMSIFNNEIYTEEFEISDVSSSQKKDKNHKVSEILSKNLEICMNTFNIKNNFDIILREFEIKIDNEIISAFLISYDSLVNTDIINLSILKPLMSTWSVKNFTKNDIKNIVYKQILSQAPIKEMNNFTNIVSEVTFGGCAVFVNGCDHAFVADVKGWGQRGVDKPVTESVLTGPQEAFTESIMTNIGLVRKILKDNDLVAQNISIGLKSQTSCAVLYIQDIANQSLIDEIKRRLQNINLDYIYCAGELEQLIEDKTFSFAPQILSTERPDRTASMIADGRVALILNGTPLALIVPVSLADFIEASEDNYVRFFATNLSKAIRILGIGMSLLLPGIFVAITTFHSEMIPTDLLFSIEATRETVPFPIVLEVLIMELSFELIREASIRVPNSVGSTLGIIGALILGQAAVAANIVSPILILITAVAGIGSFATPTVSLSRSISITKFIYIFLGSICGFLGIALGLFLNGLFLASSTSFGVPFLSPLTPSKSDPFINSIFVSPIWKREKRMSILKTQRPRKQPKISRNWK